MNSYQHLSIFRSIHRQRAGRSYKLHNHYMQKYFLCYQFQDMDSFKLDSCLLYIKKATHGTRNPFGLPINKRWPSFLIPIWFFVHYNFLYNIHHSNLKSICFLVFKGFLSRCIKIFNA